MNSKVNFYFEKDRPWKAEINKLRHIVLDCGLDEQLKWGEPCYTLNNGNVLIIHGFKEYCALLFFKGALLKDTDGLLIQQTENVQAARQIRFTDMEQIVSKEDVLKTYIYQAIEVERAGLKVEMKKTSEFTVPGEFQARLDNSPELKSAFEALTPGRQRGYLLHFAAAKQAQTREARIEKYIPKIMNGQGLQD